MITLSYIKPEDVSGIWVDVCPILSRAVLRENDITPEFILDCLINKKMQLWLGHEDYKIVYAGITQIVNYQTGRKSAQITYLAGERMDEWTDHIKVIEDWALYIGCDRLEIIGRKGFAKMHKDYRVKHITLTKDLL